METDRLGEQELIQLFMLKSLIPTAKNSKGRIYDAVFRAHRDVLTGRFYLPNYCSEKDGTDNRLVESLYELIEATKLYKIVDGKREVLPSIYFIDSLCVQYPSVEFGAIQKLVNMSLKYLCVLFDVDSSMMRSDAPLYGAVADCFDCPIDSRILKKLGTPHTPWTKMGREEYLAVQQEIHSLLEKDGYAAGNMMFDFLNW